MPHLLLTAQEHEAGNPLIPHSWYEIGLSLVVFGIVVYVIAKWVTPRFEQAYKARTDAIEGGLQRAEQAQAEAQRALETYQAQLADARHEAARIREEAREQGAAIIAEMREEAQAEARRITSTAHTQIEAERQQAVQQLRAEVGTIATTLAGNIVGESLQDDERASRVVDRFIRHLETSGEAGRTH